MFIERARLIKSNFALSPENAQSAAEICRRLDGLPLAIELAAARVRVISPQIILERLENRLKLLTGGAKDLPARQQTVRGTVEWSYELLDKDEKTLFRRLAVFAGGFTFEAAEAVCANYELQITNHELSENQKPKNKDQIEVLDGITSLLNNSLLVQKESATDEPRFRMLEVVREYALELLEASGEADAIRRRHAAYFLALGEEAEPHLQRAESIEWLNRLEVEHDNIRAVLQWSLENDTETTVRLAIALRFFWMFHSHLVEGRRWLEAALAKGGNTPAERVKLLNGLGVTVRSQDDYEKGRKMFEQALSEGIKSGLSREIALANRGLGSAAMRLGDFVSARKIYESTLKISRDLNDKSEIGHALAYLGDLELAVGEYSAGQQYLEEALAIFRELGDKEAASASLHSLGLIAYNTDDYKLAYLHFAEALTIVQKLGDKITIARSLEGFASLATKLEKAELAAKLSGAAQLIRELIGHQIGPNYQKFRDAYLAELHSLLSETEFAEFYEQGRKLKLEEAIKLALEK